MAAPFAYEEPTIEKAWRAFLSHLPALVLVLVVCAVLFGISYLMQFLTVLVSSVAVVGSDNGMSGDGATAVSLVAIIINGLIQIPFAIATNLVGILFIAIPAMFYDSGEVVTPGVAFGKLGKRPLRYLLAGFLFALVAGIGTLLCVLPGIAVMLVTPVYVSRIFTTDEDIPTAFSRSFQAVYRSPNGLRFVGIELLTGLCVAVVAFCTCSIGGVVAGPMASFYIMNSAYRQGVLS